MGKLNDIVVEDVPPPICVIEGATLVATGVTPVIVTTPVRPGSPLNVDADNTLDNNIYYFTP
jgi:hypothetical protein